MRRIAVSLVIVSLVWPVVTRAIEGHGHCPEVDIAAVSRSDDLGKSWQRSGDLMGCFDERGITNGYGGRTWSHFKTIEVSEGLAGVDRVEPDPEIRWVRGRDNLGQLPDNWAYFHYANVRFAGDKVFLMYLRGSPQLGIAEQSLHKQQHVIRIYPLEWFYE